MSYLFKKLEITIKTVGPYNHKSLQDKHGKKSMSNILSKCLTDQGQMWHKFLSLAMFTYNIFCSPSLGNYSPYELVPNYLLPLRQIWTSKLQAGLKIITHC